MNIDLVRKNKVYFNTYTSMRRLIENCYYMQNEVLNRGLYNPSGLQYANEFCTIKIGSARQAGHTTSILRVARDVFDKSMIISGNTHILKDCRQIAQHSYETAFQLGKFEFISVSNLNNCRGRNYGNKLEAVFVDASSFLSANKKEMIYEIFVPKLCQQNNYFFIFVE